MSYTMILYLHCTLKSSVCRPAVFSLSSLTRLHVANSHTNSSAPGLAAHMEAVKERDRKNVGST